jgi:N-acetylglucosamine kinase-like BadF-type ATPase
VSSAPPVVLAVDGGNSKTDLALVRADGTVVAFERGPLSSPHHIGLEGCLAVVDGLLADALARAALDGERPAVGHVLMAGADLEAEELALQAAATERGWAARTTVRNDTFAILRAGTESGWGVAVVCGAGINCVGRAAGGRISRYPSLGWETGDWGGSVMLGRDVLFHAARGEDGRGQPTALTEVVRAHFGMSIPELGEAIHYGRIGAGRLGELAPMVVRSAEDGDVVAAELVARLAEEVVLMVVRALADLGVESADVVLGGGMLRDGSGALFDEVIARLAEVAPAARPVAAVDPPVVGAALVALDAAGAPTEAGARLRAAMRAGVVPVSLPSEAA